MQQKLVPLPLDQKIQRGQDRQSRFNQRQKLLVEDQKCGLLQLAAAPPELPPTRAKYGPGLHPIHEIALLREPVVDLRFGMSVLHLLSQMALFVGDFDQEFCHWLAV